MPVETRLESESIRRLRENEAALMKLKKEYSGEDEEELSQEVGTKFPPEVKTLEAKIAYLKMVIEMWADEVTKWNTAIGVGNEGYLDLTNLLDYTKNTEIAGDRRKTLAAIKNIQSLVHLPSSTDSGTENNEHFIRILKSVFEKLEFNSKNTLGLLILGKYADHPLLTKAEAGYIVGVFFVVGTVMTLLSLSQVLPDTYACTSILLVYPLILYGSLLNIEIMWKLISCFETIYLNIEYLIFCVSSIILLRDREGLVYFIIYFILLYLNSVVGTFADGIYTYILHTHTYIYLHIYIAFPGVSRAIISKIFFALALIPHQVIYWSIYSNNIGMADFKIPSLFGKMNVSTASTCSNAGKLLII